MKYIIDFLSIIFAPFISIAFGVVAIWLLIKILFFALNWKRTQFMNYRLEVQPIEKLIQREQIYKGAFISSIFLIVAILARFVLGEGSFFPNILSPEYQYLENSLGLFEKQLSQLGYPWVIPIFILVFALYLLFASRIWLKKTRREIEKRIKQ